MRKARCVHCHVEMETVKVDRFAKPHGFAMMAAGVLFLTAIPLEAVLGYALVPFGAVVAFSKKEVWRCPRCLSTTDRISSPATESEPGR